MSHPWRGVTAAATTSIKKQAGAEVAVTKTQNIQPQYQAGETASATSTTSSETLAANTEGSSPQSGDGGGGGGGNNSLFQGETQNDSSAQPWFMVQTDLPEQSYSEQDRHGNSSDGGYGSVFTNAINNELLLANTGINAGAIGHANSSSAWFPNIGVPAASTGSCTWSQNENNGQRYDTGAIAKDYRGRNSNLLPFRNFRERETLDDYDSVLSNMNRSGRNESTGRQREQSGDDLYQNTYDSPIIDSSLREESRIISQPSSWGSVQPFYQGDLDTSNGFVNILDDISTANNDFQLNTPTNDDYHVPNSVNNRLSLSNTLTNRFTESNSNTIVPEDFDEMFNTLALSSSPRSLASTLSIEDQGGGLGKDYEINLDLNDSPNYGVPNILFSPQFNHSSVSASQNSLFSPINRHTPMIRTPTTNQSSLSVGHGFSSNGEFPGSLTPYQDRNSLPPRYNSGMRGPVVQLKFESDNNEQRSPCNNRNIGESSALVSYPGNTNFSNQTMCSCTPCPDPADKVCTFCYIPLCKNCLTTNNHTCGNAPYQTRNPAFPRQNSNVAAPRTLTAIFHNGPIQVPNSPNIVSMISVNPALQASTYPQHNPSSFLPVGNSGFQQNASRQMSNYQPFNTRMRDVASGNFCPRHPFYYVRFESSRERACSVCVLKVIGTKAAQNLLSDFISLF